MRTSLTVLGSCGAWPEPGRACSGYVLEHQGHRVVLDLGYGTATRLGAHLASISMAGVDAVLITHAHPDHMADLHAFFRARWYGDPGAAPVSLIAPAEVLEHLRQLEEPEDAWRISQVFNWRLPEVGHEVELGPLRISSRALPHYITNFGFRITAGSRTIVYTGDTGPGRDVLALSADADLLIADSTDRYQKDAGEPDGMLMTAADAGRLAQRAGVRTLLLTHFWPGNDRSLAAQTAALHFSGEVLVAEEGLRVDAAE